MQIQAASRQARLVLLLGTLAMALCLLFPAAARAADNTLPVYAHWKHSDVTYINEGGVPQTLRDSDGFLMVSEALASSGTTLVGSSGSKVKWYVVDAVGYSASKRIKVTGNVGLVLRNDTIFTASAGIEVGEGATLTVYQQPATDPAKVGKLVATGADGNAAIGGGGNAACGTVNIYGGDVSATASGGGAAIGSGRGGSGGAVRILRGTVEATAADGGAGIGTGADAGGASVNLDWTKSSFPRGQTQVTASSYGGNVAFARPYVLASDRKTPATTSNGAGKAIVPGIHFQSDVPLKEGRWYKSFTDGRSSISLPVNSSFTARIDAATLKTLADAAWCRVTDLSLAFGRNLPPGTALTLTVIRGNAPSETYTQYYYTVPSSSREGAPSVRLTNFRPMNDPTSASPAKFSIGDTDTAYLVSADFRASRASAGDVSVDVTASYDAVGGWTSGGTDAAVCEGDRLTFVGLGQISADASSVTVERQPSGSELLSGQKVYLVGVVSKQVNSSSEPVSLSGATATLAASPGTVPGTWIAPDVVAFELGDYGGIACPVGEAMQFSIDAAAEGEGNYQVKWTLCTGTAPLSAGSASSNVRRNVVSNEANGSFTSSVPSLTAELQGGSLRVPASSSPISVPFTVTSSRSYKVEVQKQTALRTFTPVPASRQQLKATTKGATVTVSVQDRSGVGSPGVYRVRFSMSDATTGDDVYRTVVVEE